MPIQSLPTIPFFHAECRRCPGGRLAGGWRADGDRAITHGPASCGRWSRSRPSSSTSGGEALKGLQLASYRRLCLGDHNPATLSLSNLQCVAFLQRLRRFCSEAIYFSAVTFFASSLLFKRMRSSIVRNHQRCVRCWRSQHSDSVAFQFAVCRIPSATASRLL